ncbi:MAG: hypothetical protein HQK57_04755 [Deltaproteobacteria bacterium]|nr:hypothetical protein [Deltaproteobacteria bacterium]
MKIWLIGDRDANRVRIGENLSQKLSWPFIDANRLLEQENNSPVSSLVAQWGWTQFCRRLDKRVRSLAQDRQDAVISLGLSVASDHNNLTLLKKKGYVVFIATAVQALLDKLVSSGRGGALSSDLAQVLETEIGLPKRYLDLEIESTGTGPSEDAERIINLLGLRDAGSGQSLKTE